MSRNQNPYQQHFTQQSTPPGDGGNLYEQLLTNGFTKQEIHSVIYKRILHQIACKKAYQQLSLSGKIQWHIQNYWEQVTGYCLGKTGRREGRKTESREKSGRWKVRKSESAATDAGLNHSFLKRLTAKGLMLLKTQWAKKPKNPI